jgi:hypothetical protein
MANFVASPCSATTAFDDQGQFSVNGQRADATQMLASFLGAGGANGGFNPLYQIGGPRSIQLALKLQF